MIRINCAESYIEILDSFCFFQLTEVFVYNFSGQSLLKPYLIKSFRPVFVNMSLKLLLAASTNSLTDSFQYNYVSCL